MIEARAPSETIPGLKDAREPLAKESEQPLETTKGKNSDSSLASPTETQPYQFLDLSPVKSVSDFWIPELQDNKFVLFKPQHL